MRQALIQAYRQTSYRVRRDRGGWFEIIVGQPLPDGLRELLPHSQADWGIITAWNPRSKPLPTRVNRKRQTQLLQYLKRHHPQARLRAAVGLSHDKTWREPSVFITHMPANQLKSIVYWQEQYAMLTGSGCEPATLYFSTLFPSS